MSFVELELQLETPLFAGGHDPLKLDELWFLRPSEVKGVWRWWARALVAGILYDTGKLRGRGKHGILKAPTPEEAGKISKIVGINMGLGYADPDPRSALSRASCYSLVVEPVNVGRFRRIYRGGPVALRDKQLNLQRQTLLALGRRQLEYLIPGAYFRLRVEEQLQVNREAVEAALAALSLAMTFSGFGKGGRRGLGCFRVVRARGTYARFFDPKVPAAERVYRAINALRRLLDIKAIESEEELPPLPSVSARKLAGNYIVRGHELRPFQVVEVRGDDAKLLEELHNFFLRSARARRLLNSPMLQDALRQRLVAWVLGLPKEQQGTGYRIIATGVDRRASPLLLAVHRAIGEGQERREGVAYLSVFASADWPMHLVWRGKSRKRSAKGMWLKL